MPEQRVEVEMTGTEYQKVKNALAAVGLHPSYISEDRHVFE